MVCKSQNLLIRHSQNLLVRHTQRLGMWWGNSGASDFSDFGSSSNRSSLVQATREGFRTRNIVIGLSIFGLGSGLGYWFGSQSTPTVVVQVEQLNQYKGPIDLENTSSNMVGDMKIDVSSSYILNVHEPKIWAPKVAGVQIAPSYVSLGRAEGNLNLNKEGHIQE